MAVAQTYVKDPDARLDYAFDWTTWLEATETISSSTVTAESGDAVVESDTEVAGIVTAWVSGGTAGTRARVTCHINTSAGRSDDRSITLDIRER